MSTTNVVPINQLENVKAQEVQVRMNDKEQPISQEAQPVDIPSRHKDQLQLPVQLHFNSQGLVKAVNARKEDSKWSLNMKRGLANLLQLSPKQESPQNNFVQQIEVFLKLCISHKIAEVDDDNII